VASLRREVGLLRRELDELKSLGQQLYEKEENFEKMVEAPPPRPPANNPRSPRSPRSPRGALYISDWGSVMGGVI
jgi:hypothetical protein